MGTRNFAHVVAIEGGEPPAYAIAAGTDGPALVVTFRTAHPGPYADGLARAPFFWPGWFPNLVGLVIAEETDWDQLGDLIEESYRVLAPKRSIAVLDAR